MLLGHFSPFVFVDDLSVFFIFKCMSRSSFLIFVEAPIIHLQTQFVCNSSEPAVLSCNVSGELSTFGFSGWIHSFDGTLLRQLDGNISDHTSFLEIKNCSFEDRGDYLCSAWNEDSTGVFLQNATTSLIVAGIYKQIVTSQQTH